MGDGVFQEQERRSDRMQKNVMALRRAGFSMCTWAMGD